MTLRLIILSLLSVSTAQAQLPEVEFFVRQYDTEELYQQAFKQAIESFNYHNSIAMIDQPEYLESNRENYCHSVRDRYALYDLTVLNSKYPSAQHDKLELRAERQHYSSGVDRDVLKVMCYPKMKILNKEGWWVDP
ncbi:hypothetical protein V4Q83_19595 (plasmid) [Acinetobacter baumannii]|nr:hypothetical protein [Acinetobacter baumannii]